MRNIQEIAEHYMIAAAWSSSGGEIEDGQPEYEGLEDFEFSQEAKAVALQQCTKFVEAAGDLLDGITDEMIGHDFWLTRAGHGVGFWDRELGEQGDKLTAICEKFGGAWVYLGDDGFLYFD